MKNLDSEKPAKTGKTGFMARFAKSPIIDVSVSKKIVCGISADELIVNKIDKNQEKFIPCLLLKELSFSRKV